MALDIGSLIYNEYVHSLLFVFGSIIIAQVFHMVLVRYVRKATEKTKTDIDDKLLRVTTVPTFLLILFIGLYFALNTLSYVEPYSELLDGAFFVGLVILISTIIARVLAVLISYWMKVQKQYEKTPRLIKIMVLIVIYLLAIIFILAHFKVDVTPLIATLGVGGIAIGLALQGTLSNLFSGFQIISDKILKVGDYIELENGVSGYVEDITWRSTKIRTLPNNAVIIPNSKLADSILTNNSLPFKEMSVVIPCGVAYGSDLEKVEKVTVEVAKEIQKKTPGAIKNFE